MLISARAKAMLTHEELTAAIVKLRPKLRRVFVMAHVLCRSRQEIAAEIGISEGRLDRRLTKALSECRARLISRGMQ